MLDLSRYRALIFFAAACLIALLVWPRAAAAQTSPEQVKAVFIVKFFDYVTWPDKKSPDESGTARICLLGGNPFGSTLSYLASKKNGSVKYKVESITSGAEAKNCHVLFSTSGSYGDLKNIAAGSGVLIIGEKSGIHEAGGIVQMYEKDDKIQLSIDLGNARDQGIKISSRLLDISDVKK